MAAPRTACCLDPRKRCGTRWDALRAWACRLTGKGVRTVTLSGDEQGRAPFYAQPVGYDGRTFHVASDHGCDTEKLLHEVCHWLCAPKERRGRANYGLGPGPNLRVTDDATADNEEVTVMLLERLLAPCFGLAEEKIARPDYNVADRRNVEWDACAERAEALFAQVRPADARVAAAV